jgi:prepilin-type processing-associated H-X9-DG protein
MVGTTIRGRFTAAFSSTELIVVITILALLGVGLIAYVAAHRSSITCTSNLKQLGLAMSMYSEANDDRLPYAYVNTEREADYKPSRQVWDSLILPLLPLGPNGYVQKHLLKCPSDLIESAKDVPRRSYAMPTHGTGNLDWPLSAQNPSGIGVSWDWNFQAKRTHLAGFFTIITNISQDRFTNYSVTVPAVHVAMIPFPSTTLLLTENIRADNTAFNYHGAVIASAAKHGDTNIDLDSFQAGKINYLMVDGHVESLYPIESTGQLDPREFDNRKNYIDLWPMSRTNRPHP